VAKGDGSERTPLGTAGRRGAVRGLEGGWEEDEEKKQERRLSRIGGVFCDGEDAQGG
jgi:hypothetical protein